MFASVRIHRRNGRRGETLAAVIIGTVVLALSISSVAVLLSSNASLETEYEKNNTVFLLQKNAESVIRRLDTSGLREGEVFFLEKDTVAKNFLLLTGSTNLDARYVNAFGEHVNSGSTSEAVYGRAFLLEKKDDSIGNGGQIIRASIKEMIRK